MSVLVMEWGMVGRLSVSLLWSFVSEKVVCGICGNNVRVVMVVSV